MSFNFSRSSLPPSLSPSLPSHSCLSTAIQFQQYLYYYTIRLRIKYNHKTKLLFAIRYDQSYLISCDTHGIAFVEVCDHPCQEDGKVDQEAKEGVLDVLGSKGEEVDRRKGKGGTGEKERRRGGGQRAERE